MKVNQKRTIKVTLYKWVRDEIDKLSYVDKTEYKGTTFKIFYTLNGKQLKKTLPYRADKHQLLITLKNIREELNINKIKKEEFKKHLRPMIAHASWLKNDGETDGKTNKNNSNKNN